MPQGRRKVPFSGKKKKEQLLAKRQAKAKVFLKRGASDDDDDEYDTGKLSENIQKLSCRSSRNSRSNANRYALQFHKETKSELSAMKEQARLPFTTIPEEEREIDHKYFIGYDFPKRPEWDYNMTKEQLDRNENRYFTTYIQNIEQQHSSENKALSLFELNLETWRQLWRVLEISDILLFVVDVRFSALMFPPSLYSYITKDLRKNMIIILNKIDLVAPEIVIAWRDYFTNTYTDLKVVLFASYPIAKADLNSKKRKTSIQIATDGIYSIFKECKEIVDTNIDLSSWEQKINEDSKTEIDDNDDGASGSFKTHKENDFDFETHTRFKDGILTIGCIGFPNAGKSSLINALKGRKVVSVSRTPGHTKHFQTIFLTENVKLCDCPGLVFPSSTPKYIQVLLGSYPIAQLREPYNSIKYLGERVDLPKYLSIQLPPDFDEWSAISICEAWALKRGFFTAKASRPDHYRAANNILRMVLCGRIPFEFYPPNYIKTKDKWISHSDIESVKKLQGDKKVNEEKHDLLLEQSEDENDGAVSDDESDSEDDGDIAATTANAFDVLDEELIT